MKRELARLVKSILESDEYTIDTVDSAIRILSKLRSKPCTDDYDVPREFRCPISKDLMRDPVILATGQTYDRSFVQKWLKEGHRMCPQTQQVLTHTILTPNHLVRELISQWCRGYDFELAPHIQNSKGEIFRNWDRHRLDHLLDQMSHSNIHQKSAAKELRILTKQNSSIRLLFGELNGSVPKLIAPLTLEIPNKDPNLQEDLISTILNLSIHDSNKKLIAESPLVIPLLVESVRCGTIETRRNSAAALFSLSALDSNKHLIGKSGAFKNLIQLLDDGNLLAMKDAASAIFNLCTIVENKQKAMCDGIVRVILKKILDRVLVDELLSILAILSSQHKFMDEMGELGALPCLLGILKENTCERNKENCVSILYAMCYYDGSKLRVVREEEHENGTISRILETGTSRAKRKANGILERMKKVYCVRHSA